MKSRQFIWLLLFSTALNLQAFAFVKTNNERTASKKAFILIRSEENQFQLKKFKEQINNNLMLQNVSVQIETYRKSEQLPQAKIFKTAYSGNYDVILLIDQVVKYSIDNRVTNSVTKVGSKYKIRSYNLKKTPYTWIDHGDSNCNISVNMSLKAFTDKILISMNIEPTKSLKSEDIQLAENNNLMSTYNKLLVKLKRQRLQTLKIINEINAIEKQLDKTVTPKPDLADISVENYKN